MQMTIGIGGINKYEFNIFKKGFLAISNESA